MEGKVDIKVEAKGLPQLISEGFAIPPIFSVQATWADGDTVRVEVEVEGGTARTTSAAVMTDRREGVTATLLQKAPIRDVVASGARALLQRVELTGSSSAELTPITDRDFAKPEIGARAVAAIKKLVRWDPDFLQKGTR